MFVVFKAILLSFIKNPILFIKNLNFENIQKFRAAINQESPILLSNNISNYFENTSEHSTEVDEKKIDKFVEVFKNRVKPDQEAVLFIGHEATMTGAPLILLKTIEELKRERNIFPIILLCRGGSIESRYQQLGNTFTFPKNRNPSIDNKELNLLLTKLGEIHSIDKAIINSVESRRFLKTIRKHKFRISFLIHELGNLYPKNAWNIINKNSDKIIFPATFVKKRALENNQIDEDRTSVQAQGLLKPQLLQINKAKAKIQLRKQLNLPEEAIVVLGTGTGIPRKGIDFFINVAISVLANSKLPFYFLWLGEMPINDYKYWIEKDIIQSKNQDRILLLGEQTQTETYFCGSDLFLMTSRGDPFPCVVQEAVAAKLFILGFENVGGFTELINEQNGLIFPYGDVHGMVNSIINESWKNDSLNFDAAIRRLNSMDKYAEYIFNSI